MRALTWIVTLSKLERQKWKTREGECRRRKDDRKKENIEGGKAKRKHRDKCEKKYIQSPKCFRED